MPGALQRPAVVSRVSDLVGYTPLLELASTGTGSRLLLKLEMFNPTGTAKIRMARAMVDAAEAAGELRPGGRIVESTSGNTGLGLAVIAAERGYVFTAVVDHHACPDKLRGMKALGTELVYVVDDGTEELATAAREELAEEMARGQDNTVFTEQHNNPANGVGYFPVAHELHEALGGRIDVLIGAVGTGGALCGTGRELRKLMSGFTVIGVEPKGSIAFGGPAHDYYQSGTGTPEGAEIGALVDFDLIDEGSRWATSRPSRPAAPSPAPGSSSADPPEAWSTRPSPGCPPCPRARPWSPSSTTAARSTWTPSSTTTGCGPAASSTPRPNGKSKSS